MAFNHIYAAQLTTDGQPAGSKNRRALAIAGDDPAAKIVVTNLLDQFGFARRRNSARTWQRPGERRPVGRSGGGPPKLRIMLVACLATITTCIERSAVSGDLFAFWGGAQHRRQIVHAFADCAVAL